MIPFEEALSIVLEKTKQLPTESLSLNRLSGKILAENICTKFPLPLFDNSAVDGYALRAEEYTTTSTDMPVILNVTQTIRAGESGLEPLQAHQAIRIMTGAQIPPGADAVVMREEVEAPGGLFIRNPVTSGANIRRRGEELQEGITVLKSGTRITPPVIGMLATLGLPTAKVCATPRITFIVTGDELKQPGEELSPGQIYDSNGPALTAAAASIGIENIRVRYAIDQREQLKATVAAALDLSDIVVTLGGISVGDYDFVREVNSDLGVQEYFWRVAMKPGKPTFFGEVTSSETCKLVFGLPGNPVAALVTFAMLVRPAIRVMMGDHEPVPPRLTARLERSVRKKEGRLEFVRGRYSESAGVRHVIPVKGQESHMVSGLAAANCVIVFPREEAVIEQESVVEIIPLEWGL